MIDKMKSIYLDYQSTTPVDKDVLKKMLPYFSNFYGNPHSINHAFGQIANDAIEKSRDSVAKIIGASSKEIIFTSGATESNNLAIKGSYLQRVKSENRNKIIVATTEHKCVIEASLSMKNQGAKVVFLNVNKNGIIDLDHLKSIIDDDVAIVSVMMANNEIGTLQPIKEISILCKKYNIWLHTDAAQALGNTIINVDDLGIDLLSISGHKIYVPKGIGALYVRRRPRIRLISQVDGGGQERLIRSGTLPTPLVVGVGESVDLISKNMDIYYKHNIKMRNLLNERLLNLVSSIKLNGPELNNRLCNNLNYNVKGLDAAKLVELVGGEVAFSTGSACSTGGIEPSYVLKSIGLSDQQAMSSFRISVGRYTTDKDIELATKIISNNIKKLI